MSNHKKHIIEDTSSNSKKVYSKNSGVDGLVGSHTHISENSSNEFETNTKELEKEEFLNEFGTVPSNFNDQESALIENILEEPNFVDKDPIEPLPKTRLGKVIKRIKDFIANHRKQLILAGLALFILGGIGASAAGVWLLNRYNNLADGNIVAEATNIDEGSIVYDRNNIELFRYSAEGQQREVVSIDQIPDQMRGAIIALEDENFYDNQSGIPWQNMVGATYRCFVSGGETCRGGSGLSQQLIKNVTGNDQRTLGRKLDELLLAIRFNQEINPGGTPIEKQEAVLEAYLNWVPFGRNTYGVQAASRTYFNKDINSGELTLPEACYLASMVQRPSAYAAGIDLKLQNRNTPEENQVPNPDFDILESRKNSCLEKMFTLNLKDRGTDNFITAQEELLALQEEVVNFQERPKVSLEYGHLRSYLSEELTKKLGIQEKELATQGYKITTTFDKNIQDQVQTIIQNNTDSLIVANGGNNAASVVMDGPTGQLIAMIGSRDFNNEEIQGQVNVATAPRQPGSSYKPYVYASAFNNGFNPGTILLDLSTDFGNYRPANFSRTTIGQTNIRSSLQNSYNIPAVKAAYLSQGGGTSPNATPGINAVMDLAELSGVEHPFRDTCTLSAAVGACELTPLSHTTGINTLLQNGNKITAKPFLSVIFQDRFSGEEINIYEQNKDAYRDINGAVNPLIARQITNVMADYSARSAGVWGNSRFNLQLEGWDGANQVAAKTGTTNDVKDTWTVGGSPLYTVTVWVGNTDGAPMNSTVSSSQAAAPIWNQIMKTVHAGKTPVGFSTEGLQRFNIDPTTGLPGEGRSELMTDDQISALRQAENNLNNADYNPLVNSILQNRTPIVSRKLFINRLDGKLIPELEEGQESDFPAELVEEINCRDVISEFPVNQNWLAPAEAYKANLGEDFTACPTEITDLNLKDKGPQITVNFESGETLPEILTVQATPISQDSTITNISFSIGGVELESVSNQNRLEIDLGEENINGVKDVIIRVSDSFGLISELVIENVDFDDVFVPRSSSSSFSSQSSSSQNNQENNNPRRGASSSSSSSSSSPL